MFALNCKSVFLIFLNFALCIVSKIGNFSFIIATIDLILLINVKLNDSLFISEFITGIIKTLVACELGIESLVLVYIQIMMLNLSLSSVLFFYHIKFFSYSCFYLG